MLIKKKFFKENENISSETLTVKILIMLVKEWREFVRGHLFFSVNPDWNIIYSKVQRKELSF